jgi:hypothetical protein
MQNILSYMFLRTHAYMWQLNSITCQEVLGESVENKMYIVKKNITATFVCELAETAICRSQQSGRGGTENWREN